MLRVRIRLKIAPATLNLVTTASFLSPRKLYIIFYISLFF
jgi:hypothetical protein